MLEFKVIENLKTNKDLTDILKEFKYTVKLGQIKTILHTNLQVIIPTEYQITYHTTLTILEYKVRIENVFGEEYSKERLKQRLYLSKQIVFKPMSQKSIIEEYSKTNKPHKGIYGLYLYYCYLLGVLPKNHPKQYLTYSIRKEVYKLEQISQQVRFIHEKNIVTKEDLDNYSKNNPDELSELKGKRENLWRRYHRAKTEDKQTQILAEINDIQPKIKELYKYDKYCKEITKRAEGIQNNLNNFDKDIQKEKDNSRSL